MARELDRLLWEIESRGGRITTHELLNLNPRIGQYQRALKQLRERLALKGWTLTKAEEIEGQPGSFMYRLIKPKAQLEMFAA